jgi:hypothetical protein
MSEIKKFRCGIGAGHDEIQVEIINTEDEFRWRMCVNGSWSQWTGLYHSLLVHEGYGLVTNYFDDDVKAFVPFKIQYASEVS